jgi:hypothetical protein
MRYLRPIFGIGLVLTALALGGLALPASAAGQQPAAAPLTRAHLDELESKLQGHMERERNRLAALQRQVDVATLFYRLSDVAHVDQVRFFGPAAEDGDEPRAITALVFVPKRVDGDGRGSLLIWQRGDAELEIESWSDVPELRELLGRGVTVIAPTYEGAPEERLDAVRDYALERYPFLEDGRVDWREPR